MRLILPVLLVILLSACASTDTTPTVSLSDNVEVYPLKERQVIHDTSLSTASQLYRIDISVDRTDEPEWAWTFKVPRPQKLDTGYKEGTVYLSKSTYETPYSTVFVDDSSVDPASVPDSRILSVSEMSMLTVFRNSVGELHYELTLQKLHGFKQFDTHQKYVYTIAPATSELNKSGILPTSASYEEVFTMDNISYRLTISPVTDLALVGAGIDFTITRTTE